MSRRAAGATGACFGITFVRALDCDSFISWVHVGKLFARTELRAWSIRGNKDEI